VKEIFQKVAEEFNISPEQVEHCWKHQWHFVWMNMREPEHPAILVNNLGTFSLRKFKLKEMISKYENYIQRHPRETSIKRLGDYREWLKTVEEYEENKKLK